MSYVFLSINTTNGSAYEEGQIVEVGAVRTTKRGKMVGNFQVINFVEDIDSYNNVELSLARDTIIGLGEPSDVWLIRLKDFIGDSKVVIYEGYETYNFLSSYGLELENLIDLRLVLRELGVKNYGEFLKLINTIKVDRLAVPKGLLKSIVLKELFFKNKVSKVEDRYLNDLLVIEKVRDYTGVYIEGEDNFLYYEDGTKELVESDVDKYEEYLISIYDSELEYFGGETELEEALEVMDSKFEDVYFDYDKLGVYNRATIEGSTYLITPTTLHIEDNLNLELVYDTKKMTKNESFRQVDKAVYDDVIREYFKSLIRGADPNYEVKEYDYFRDKLVAFNEDIVRKLNEFNNKSELLRVKALNDFDLVTIGGKVFTLDIYEENRLLVYKVFEGFVEEGLDEDVELETTKVIELKKEVINSLEEEDFSVDYDEDRYNYVVVETGVKALEWELEELSMKLGKTVQGVVTSIPKKETKVYDLTGLDLNKVYNEYGSLSKITYTPIIDNEGDFRGIRTQERGYMLSMYFNGRVEYINRSGKKVEVKDLNDLLEEEELLYKRVEVFYKDMDKMFEYSYDDIVMREDESIINFRHDEDDEGYEDVEYDVDQTIVTNISGAKVSNVVDNVEVGIPINRVFNIDGMIKYLEQISGGEDTVEFENTETEHLTLLGKIKEEVNKELVGNKIEDIDVIIDMADGEIRIEDSNIYIDYQGRKLDFILDGEDSVVLFSK